MTRDEAIAAVQQTIRDAPVLIRPDDNAQWAAVIVNTLAALGFTFTAPRSIPERLQDQLAHTPVSFTTVWCAIDAAGLKLVDK